MTGTTPHHHQATGARGCQRCSMGGFQTTYLHQGSASSFFAGFCREVFTFVGLQCWPKGVQGKINMERHQADFNEGLDWFQEVIYWLKSGKPRLEVLTNKSIRPNSAISATFSIFSEKNPGISTFITFPSGSKYEELNSLYILQRYPRIPSASKDDPQQSWEMIKL